MKHHDPAAIRRAKIIRTIVMVFLCVLSLLPFYLMFVNGTRTSNEVKSGISFWFGSNLLENLHNFDLKQRGLGVTALGSMVNSLLVTVPATALSVYFSALTAYGIHAYDFKLKKAAWGFILAVMMVPTQVFAIGYYKFMIQLKLIDTYWPLIIRPSPRRWWCSSCGSICWAHCLWRWWRPPVSTAPESSTPSMPSSCLL